MRTFFDAKENVTHAQCATIGIVTKEAAELALSLQNAPLANRLIGLSLESHKVLFTVKDKRTSEILFLSEKIAKLELERKQ